MKTELVVARYEEPLVWLANVPTGWELTVYNKGTSDPAIPRDGSVITLPNVGREGHTFLTHVIDRYDSLSDVTVFVQGNPFDHVEVHELLRIFSQPSQPTQPIGRWLVCDSTGSPHHPGLPIDAVAQTMNVEVRYPLGFVAGAMFRVAKADILAHAKAFYENARAILLQHDLFGYCLERLWPAIWRYAEPEPIDDVWGVLYTHHQVADKVLAATLASIRAMGLPDERLVICGQHDDARFPEKAHKVFHTPSDPAWVPAIYEQMIAGLSQLPPGVRTLTLEHDVFYPVTYLSTMAEAIKDPSKAYYYTLVRHVDIRPGQRQDFWASDAAGTRTLQSCCGGWANRLLELAKADLQAYRDGVLNKGFELGMPTGWARVDAEQPVLDVRQGHNSTDTGYHAGTFLQTDYLPYWGYARHLRSRIM